MKALELSKDQKELTIEQQAVFFNKTGKINEILKKLKNKTLS